MAQVCHGVAVNDSPGFKELVVEHPGQAIVSAYLRLRLAVHPAENKEICLKGKISVHQYWHHIKAQHKTAQYNIALYSIVQSSAKQLCAVQLSAVQYNALQNCMI